jgi:hypothetical protein
MTTHMTSSKALAWSASLLVLATIVGATLLPVSFRPRLPIPVDVERGLAFASLGCCLAIANGRNYLFIGASIIVIAGGLEWLQTLSETRHGHIHDFNVKAVGAIVGVLLAVGGRALVVRIQRLALSR